ncbi:MAG: hypothetical protein ABIT01_03745 [Thermoanaerobaculia bacterium]
MIAALPGRAEERCGSMSRELSRFRGTVRSVVTAGEFQGVFTPVDSDPQFVVTILVDAVGKGTTEPGAGSAISFGIHSPSRTFGADSAIGKSFELEAERMDCDGVFRRFLTFEQPGQAHPETFQGDLKVGGRYRAAVKRGPEGVLALVEPLRLPMHHGGGVSFENADSFPELKSGDAHREIEFEIVRLRISQRSSETWLSLFEAEIRGVW